MIKQFFELAGSYEQDVVNFLRDIVTIPSPVGGEGKVIHRIRNEMEKLGYDEVWIDPLGNLIGRIGSGSRVLAFDGHCDTVDVGNAKLWSCDPFKGDIRDGYIFGLGSCDQKGGLAAAVYAGKIIKEKSALMKDATLLVVASVLEEGYEGYNWDYIIEQDKIRPHAVVLTEPSNLRVAIGHKGRADIKIIVEGVSSHGSRPDLGDNAVYKMAAIIEEVKGLDAELPTGEFLGSATLAVTRVHSFSPNLNAVPDGAEIYIDRRLTDDETTEIALKQIRELPAVVAAGARVEVVEVEVESFTGIKSTVKSSYSPWGMAEGHPLVKSARTVYEKQFASPCNFRTWDFSTNGVSTKGKFDIPTIGFGPGNDEWAHRPDERVPIDHLIQAMGFYASLTHHWQSGS